MARDTKKMQIYDLLKGRIESGFYPPGAQLPKEVDLAVELGVSRVTLRPALELPKLIAMPSGMQLGSWVTEPESFAFEVLCCFVNRSHGAFGYWFPRGYDHRYWNAYAKANKTIAEHEETVLKGQETGQVVFTPVTPLPKPFSLSGPASWHTNRTIFQFRAFRKGEEIVAALGNFWLKGELFANMKISGLAARRQYAVNSSEGYSLGVFSGAELKKGILVHAGALRWNFFRIRPGSELAGKVISQTGMKSEMRKRLPQIEKMFAWEKEYAAKMQAEIRGNNPVNDFKTVKPLSNNSVSLKAVWENERDFLEITVPGGRVLIDPTKGASAVSMKINGKELVHSQGFAMDGFWSPKKAGHLIEKGYRITGMKKTAQGIGLEFTHSISNLEKPALAGLKIFKSFLFTPRGMTVKTRISSHAMIPLRFAFRFHNIPAQLEGTEGRADFGKTTLERSQQLKIVRFGAAEKEIDTAYSVGKFLDSKVKSFTLRRAGYPDLSISLSGAPAYGAVFWDAGTFSTVEPVFRTRELEPGASKDFIMDMKW